MASRPSDARFTLIRCTPAIVRLSNRSAGSKPIGPSALSTGMALLVRRPWLDRLLIVASAIPIALIANVIRITVTGLLHEYASSETANAFFHDLAGWFMMPLALAMLWLGLWIFDHLLVPFERQRPIGVPVVARQGPAGQSKRKKSSKKAKGVPLFFNKQHKRT